MPAPLRAGSLGHDGFFGQNVQPKPAGTIAFVAPSGYGKSTIALSMALAGYPLQADDCLILESCPGNSTPMVVPSYPGGRLWADSSAALGGHALPGKHHLPVPFSPEPSPLTAIFILDEPAPEPSTGITVDRLSGREAFLELIAQGYHLDASGPLANRGLFEHFGRIVELVPMYRLRYVRNLDGLAGLHAVVLNAAIGDG